MRNLIIIVSLLVASTVAFAGATFSSALPKQQSATDGSAAKTAAIVSYVEFKTTKGSFVVEVDATNAPLSAENFVQYVKDGFYNGTSFHRVIPGFMIQGGGFTSDMAQKETRAPIKNEWRNGLKNSRGTLSMARTNIADSATSQFFVNLTDNAALDMARDGAAYAVFGHVVSGMDVIDAIAAVKTRSFKGHKNVPEEAVLVESATVIEKPAVIQPIPAAPTAAAKDAAAH
ncbi:MAG: peptidylprolyl isomerase [Planctomycetota bacterium]|nr:peptidylprolyl isomerase [Planctomycetota bacterium]